MRILDGDVEYISPDGMILPSGVAILGRHGTDALYVADTQTLRQVMPVSGAQLGIEYTASGFTALQPPTSVSVDGSNLVLSSWLSSTVQVWDPENREVIDSHALPAGTFPFDAVGFQGSLAVTTLDGLTGNTQVARITGETLLGFPGASFHYLLGLAASGDVLFVSDWTYGLVWTIDASASAPVASVVVAGLSFPEGLALDHSGGLLVIEAGAGRVARVDLATGDVTTVAEGLALGLAGAPPSTPPHLALNGIAVGSSGDIFVTGDKADVLYRITQRNGESCSASGPASF